MYWDQNDKNNALIMTIIEEGNEVSFATNYIFDASFNKEAWRLIKQYQPDVYRKLTRDFKNFVEEFSLFLKDIEHELPIYDSVVEDHLNEARKRISEIKKEKHKPNLKVIK